MNNRPYYRHAFDIRHWLRKAGRRTLGFLLLLASIGGASVHAWHAVDTSVLPAIERSITHIKESSS